MKNPYDPEQVQKFLAELEGISGAPHFHTQNYQEQKVELKPDPRIEPARFKPHPDTPNIYYAHPDTIHAVRKDIFAAGEDDVFIDLEKWGQCLSCRQRADLQFWHCCPYCLGKLLEI